MVHQRALLAWQEAELRQQREAHQAELRQQREAHERQAAALRQQEQAAKLRAKEVQAELLVMHKLAAYWREEAERPGPAQQSLQADEARAAEQEALQQRDASVLERDAAVSERNAAILERDAAMLARQNADYRCSALRQQVADLLASEATAAELRQQQQQHAQHELVAQHAQQVECGQSMQAELAAAEGAAAELEGRLAAQSEQLAKARAVLEQQSLDLSRLQAQEQGVRGAVLEALDAVVQERDAAAGCGG